MSDRVHCPDGGYCHHSCETHSPDECFRVSCCGPLTGVFPNEEWPVWVQVDPRPVAMKGKDNE